MTDPIDRPEEADYGLVMPFVACTSQGGPYDDAAFVAGFECGQIDRALQVIAAAGGNTATFTVGTDVVKQLELIGMNRGFPIVHTEAAFEGEKYADWHTVTFTKSQEQP